MDINEIDPKIRELMWRESSLLWTVHNNFKTERGVEFEFLKHRFLKDIFDDWTPEQTCRKSSQIGYSNMVIVKAMHAAKYLGYNIIYTLPTSSDVGQFVSSKVNAIIGHNPLLANLTKDKDSIVQKKVGNGYIYYRGTFSQKTEKEKSESNVGIMLSSDLNIHDEADRSDQTILEQYESRLDASDYKGKWYFSNPTNPFTLSQKKWAVSDQKHWFIKCSHCNLWQYLDFWKNIKNGGYVCKKCKKKITDEDRANGQWVKKFKNKSVSGYWINHLMCPWIPAGKIVEQEKNSTKQYFYNFVLGLPYVGSDVVVNKEVILKAIEVAENPKEYNCIGVDSGLKKHYVLGNKYGIFKVGVVDDWKDIEDLMKIYDVQTAVFDALPDLTEPRKLRDKYPGVVWLHFFKREIKKADFISWDDKTRSVYSDRSKIIQQIIDELIDRKMRFHVKPEELTDYIEHWGGLFKTQEKDTLGILRDVWESNGNDHYALATVYFRLSLDRTGESFVKEWEDKQKAIDADMSPDVLEEARKTEFNYYD